MDNSTWLAWGGLSAVLFVGTLIAVPVLIAQMSPDYFVRTNSAAQDLTVPRRWVRRVVRNVVGLLLVAVGVAMLVLPGQGVLTILIGLAVCEFPGKRRLERRIVASPRIRRALNWMRARSSRPPFTFESSSTAPTEH